MKRHFFQSALVAAATLLTSSSWSQFISVPQNQSGFFVRSEPTVVALRESANARAVLLTIPGGTGRIGFLAGAPFNPDAEPRSSFARVLRLLTDNKATSGTFHSALFDSPYAMPMDAHLAARAAKDHMVRIDSVVAHLRERYKLPIWIMGHSNGGFSIAQYLQYLQSEKREDAVAGFIFSSGRAISRFGSSAALPALFISGERDGCHSTSHSDNKRLYERFKALNKAPTEFVVVAGGEEEGGDPCTSGVHMYNKAHDEVARAIDAFAKKQFDGALGQPAR